jgi:serine phosphatase RsbU (regulator of sigma subunit)/PAS domain-containing protein
MAADNETAALESQIADLVERAAALRHATSSPGAKPGANLEAALSELDLALELIARMRDQIQSPPHAAPDRGTRTADLERRLLRTVFQAAPTPMFLLGTDGMVRRVNGQAANLLGMPRGYATGKPLPAFVDLSTRAALRSQLNAVVHTRRPRRVRCNLLSTRGRVDTVLTVDLIEVAGEAEPVLVAVAGAAELATAPAERPSAPADRGGGTRNGNRKGNGNPEGKQNRDGNGNRNGDGDAGAGTDRAIAAVTQRFDMMTAATRLLLDNATSDEALTLRRCARLLAAEMNAWVITDVQRGGRLRREIAVAPGDQPPSELSRTVEQAAPPPGSLPAHVYASGQSRLLSHVEDTGILGSAPSGVPVLTLLGVTSVLCVPLLDGDDIYGTMTLARRADDGPLEVAELGVVEELGEQLALTVKVDRMFLRRSEVADVLQASLLPRKLPSIPGIELAATCVPATEGVDVGGDFYDVYRSPDGWGASIGDVRGKGEEAAAVAAMARHTIRTLAHWEADPVQVLINANEVMRAQPDSDRFVTACAVHLRQRGKSVALSVGSAGHPGAILVGPDGRTRMLSGGGFPLGLFEDADPAGEKLRLQPGGTLVLYSDGVTDARNADGNYFGDRLSSELKVLAGKPVSRIVSALKEVILDFSHGNLRDDMTLLAIRATGERD